MRAAILIFALAALPQGSEVRQIVGKLVIGAVTYTLNGTVVDEAHDTRRVSLSLSRGDTQEHTLVLVLRASASSVVLDGVTTAVPDPLAAQWRAQVMGVADLERFDCTEKREERICDSRTPVALSEGLSGRLRLSYNRQRLTGIRFYSLAEFNNPWFQNVALILDFR